VINREMNGTVPHNLKTVALAVRDIIGVSATYITRGNSTVELTSDGKEKSAPDDVEESLKCTHSYTFTISQPAFELKKLKFDRKSNIISELSKNPCNTKELSISFIKNHEQPYIQRYFSDTEKSIIETAFGYFSRYESNIVFLENYQLVLNFLEESPLSKELSVEEIFDVFQFLSPAISDLHILTTAFPNGEMMIRDMHSVSRENELTQDYIERLRNDYLNKFYSNWTSEKHKLQVGIDPEEDSFKIEFHFSSQAGKSKIYIVEYQKNIISVSVFRALLTFFSELHIRERTKAIEKAKGEYLVQVRHSLTHHFSAATKSITHMYRRWEKGTKFRFYWNNLFDDPIFKKQLKRSLWSLSQARMLIENGQFLIEDIHQNSINRKPYSIIKVIRNSLIMVDDEKERKNINITSRSTGTPPSVMNGDNPLMHIAMLNLIDNAIKYSINSGEVRWSLFFGKDHYKFSISNYGSQISESQIQIIIQEGNRGEQANHLNPRHGTGFGLPIAIKILKAHHSLAKLQITSVQRNENEYGGWFNTFSFTMPYLTGQSREKLSENHNA